MTSLAKVATGTLNKWHFNPETGKTGVCHARIKCDFAEDGVNPPHFSSESEARAAYNLTMSDKVVAIGLQKPRPVQLTQVVEASEKGPMFESMEKEFADAKDKRKWMQYYESRLSRASFELEDASPSDFEYGGYEWEFNRAKELFDCARSVYFKTPDLKNPKYDANMPSAYAQYFADTEKKHFNLDSPGSQFTELKNLGQVLAAAEHQRGSLDGDDREYLIEMGADPKSFAPDRRYICAETPGVSGVVKASELNPDEIVTVIQKSEKAKPMCQMTVKKKTPTQIATIVLVDNPTLPGTEGVDTLLITAFPGVSGPSGSNNDLLPYVGKQLTLGQASEIYGRDFEVNTILEGS